MVNDGDSTALLSAVLAAILNEISISRNCTEKRIHLNAANQNLRRKTLSLAPLPIEARSLSPSSLL